MDGGEISHEEMPPAPPPPYYGAYNEPDDDSAKFRHAVAEGDIQTAEALLNASLALDEPVDFVTKAHWHGSTALFEAARAGHLEMVKWLVSRGGDPDHTNEWGDSPANEAASMGHWNVVWYLADHGADLKRTSEHAHSTILLSAIRHRSTAALKELQRRGVDMKQKSWNGATAIHEAARIGESDMLEWLVSSTDLDVNATNDQGEGAIQEAAMMGHADAVMRLIRAGADTGSPGSQQAASLVQSAVTHSNLDLLKLLSSRGSLELGPDKHGRVPLIEAVRSGDKAVVEWLLEKGANASAVSGSGEETPVAIAAMENHFDLLWRLADAGADLKVLNEYGGNALLSAAHHGRDEDVAKLLDRGLDVNHANHRGDTALTIAASRGDVKLLELLLKRGASAEPRGARKDTVLIRAARFRRDEATTFLLEQSGKAIQPPLDLNSVNKRGDTALLEAIRAASVEVATLLLEKGADPLVKNSMGMTPLLEAAEVGSMQIAKLVVHHLHHAEGSVSQHQQETETERLRHAIEAKNRHGDGVLELCKWTAEADELATYFKSLGAVEAPHSLSHSDYAQ